MSSKTKSSYQIMTSILSDYNPTYNEKLTVNSFFLCRWLSNNPNTVFVGNVINRYYNEIPLNRQYDMSKQILRGKIKYIQFPKKIKNSEKVINNICRYYKVSIDDAYEYWELMNTKERNKMERMYDGA